MKIIEFMFKCRDSRSMTVYVHQHMHSGKKLCNLYPDYIVEVLRKKNAVFRI